MVGKGRARLFMALLVVAAAYGCSTEEQIGSELANSGVFAPAPVQGERNSVAARLSRFEGQDSYLNPGFSGAYRLTTRSEGAEGAETAALGDGTEQRGIQDSDIYKVGRPGSKLLYLLNNHRGLQVISFAGGPESPQLVGRVPATGNHPETMYYLDDQDQVLVVERVWVDDAGSQQRQQQKSRVLLYDVSNASDPRIIKTTTFLGHPSDTRLVGDILYIAASKTSMSGHFPRTSSSTGLAQEDKPEGMVYSYKIGRESVEKIAEHKLALPAYREDMNIVEVAQENGLYKYFLLAVVSESRWAWWGANSSMVEVVDITDPRGTISPIVVAPARGRIISRSSTHIDQDTLVVVSNYRIDGDRWIERVAVETFHFPSPATETLDQDEVNFRRQWIQRELRTASRNGANAEQLLALRRDLEAHSEFGLRGRLLKTEQGHLEKLVADSFISVGDTRGMSARLQDVRFNRDLLYVFWVPQDNIDPLEVFDVSDVRSGTPHLGRLEFEGWIERSFPLHYNGKDYILGLGQIIPAVNNEFNRRHPQARLFEIKRQGSNRVRAVDVAELTFEGSNVWTNFGAHDRFVELRMSGDGQGVILFQVTQTQQPRFVSGGKMIGFDLNNVDSGEVFKEGGLLQANWGWLRRVFTNPDLELINTFSDEELAVYSARETGVAGEVYDAIGVLELARNAREFVNITAELGIQVIEKGQSYFWSQDERSQTQLRLVGSLRADNELADVTAQVSLQGSFVDLVKHGNTILVMTRVEKLLETEEESESVFGRNPRQVTSLEISKINVDSQGLSIVASSTLQDDATHSRPTSMFGRMPWYFPYVDGQFLTLAADALLVLYNKDLYYVDTDSANATKISLTACDLDQAISTEAKLFSGSLNLIASFAVNTDGDRISELNHRDVNYSENFLIPVSVNVEEKSGICGTPVNVPGNVIDVRGSHIVTDDQRLVDTITHSYEYINASGERQVHTWHEDISERALTSLNLNGNKASLADLYSIEREQSSYWWSLADDLQRLDDGRFVYLQARDERNHRSHAAFVTISFDPSSLRFLQQKHYLNLAVQGTPVITDLIYVNSETFAVIRSGRLLQVARLPYNERPEVLKSLQKLDHKFNWGEAQDHIVLSQPYYRGWFGQAGSSINFDPENGVINVSQGLSGFTQIKLR